MHFKFCGYCQCCLFENYIFYLFGLKTIADLACRSCSQQHCEHLFSVPKLVYFQYHLWLPMVLLLALQALSMFSGPSVLSEISHTNLSSGGDDRTEVTKDGPHLGSWQILLSTLRLFSSICSLLRGFLLLSLFCFCIKGTDFHHSLSHHHGHFFFWINLLLWSITLIYIFQF